MSASARGGGSAAPTSLVAGNGFYLRQFDLFRAVACVCVVAQHSVLWPVTAGSSVGWSFVMVLHFSRNAFFFLSAFVASYSQRTRPRSTTSLWYRRITQVLVPYLCWTAIYFTYSMIADRPPSGGALGMLWSDVWHGYYQLYFIVVLVQFYVLLPALLWLVERSRRYHGWVLAASVVFQMAMVTVTHYFSWGTGAPGVLRHVDLDLLTSRSVVGYQLYFVLGLLAADHADELDALVRKHARRILVGSGALLGVALGYYAVGLAIGQSPGHASDLYQPVATAWFVAALAGLYALGWRWAERSARHPGTRLDRLVTWGSDASGGFYLSHVLVLQLILTGLDDAGLKTAGSWAAVSAVLFVATIGVTALFVGVVLRTPLRWVLTGPDRTEERSGLSWYPSRRRVQVDGPPVSAAVA